MNKKEKELDKRNRIMVATEAVFSRRGYAQATVDEIIALADTGKGTLYKYFGSKDDLFYTLVSQKHNELMMQMQSVAGDVQKGIEERLVGILTVWIDFLRKNTVLWQVLCFEMTCSNRGYSAVETENGGYHPCDEAGQHNRAGQSQTAHGKGRLLFGAVQQPVRFINLSKISAPDRVFSIQSKIYLERPVRG